MRTWACTIACAVILSWTPSAWAGELSVSIKDGRVTLVAKSVPLRQILAEWSRVGQTKIVGSERLGGPPLTLQFDNVPEHQALETLLRSASGYMAAPRATLVANASMYDRILILPTSNAPAAAPAAASAAAGRAGTFMPGGVARGTPPPVVEEEVVAEPAEEVSDLPADITEAQRRGEEDPDANNVGQVPPESNFDYANPQLMLQRRQQQPQQGQTPGGASTPGTILAPPAQTPNVFPGTTTVPRQQTPPTSSRPGEVLQQAQPQQFNPYGLPSGVQPGSVVGPAVEPDRAKYMNPYQPQPPKDPKD